MVPAARSLRARVRLPINLTMQSLTSRKIEKRDALLKTKPSSHRAEVSVGVANDHVGTGQPANSVTPGMAGYKERVDFGTIIGNWVDPSTGQKMPTTNGIIHYSKDGVHIVPSRP